MTCSSNSKDYIAWCEGFGGQETKLLTYVNHRLTFSLKSCIIYIRDSIPLQAALRASSSEFTYPPASCDWRLMQTFEAYFAPRGPFQFTRRGDGYPPAGLKLILAAD